MKKTSLATLSPTFKQAPIKDLPEDDILLTSDIVNKKTKDSICQVAIRMTRKERLQLQKIALDSEITVQDLVMQALAEYKSKRGIR